jgi:predicted molibdopterin-dependent oxidoreductase YjgC
MYASSTNTILTRSRHNHHANRQHSVVKQAVLGYGFRSSQHRLFRPVLAHRRKQAVLGWSICSFQHRLFQAGAGAPP